MRSRLVIGCMSGTSLDGIDAALVRIEGEGLGMKAKLVSVASRGFGELGARLSEIASGGSVTAERYAEVALALGEAHVEVIEDLLKSAGGGGGLDDKIALIAVHGQTVFHSPPVSLQLMNVAPVGRAFGAPVGFDFRAADLAAGGQGAPITPMADYVVFGDGDEHRVIVNLGGFINYTDIGRVTESRERDLELIEGGDLCACNQLLDAIARLGLGAAYDEDGRAAARGETRDEIVSEICGMLARQATAGRSLGTGDELADWVGEGLEKYAAEDMARSACEAIGRTLGGRINPEAHLILAGGGAKNRVLVESIGRNFSGKLSLSDEVGEEGVGVVVGVEYREAMAMAVLGALSRDGIAITLGQITGVKGLTPVAGSWIEP